jgi:hypothetical protein
MSPAAAFRRSRIGGRLSLRRHDFEHEHAKRVSCVNCDAGVTRFDLAALHVAVCTSDVGPERAHAVDNRRQPAEDPLEVVVLHCVRRQLQFFHYYLPERLSDSSCGLISVVLAARE